MSFWGDEGCAPTTHCGFNGFIKWLQKCLGKTATHRHAKTDKQLLTICANSNPSLWMLCVDTVCLSRVVFLVPTVKISSFVVPQDDMLASIASIFCSSIQVELHHIWRIYVFLFISFAIQLIYHLLCLIVKWLYSRRLTKIRASLSLIYLKQDVAATMLCAQWKNKWNKYTVVDGIPCIYNSTQTDQAKGLLMHIR